MRHTISEPSERVTSFAISCSVNYSRPSQHNPRLFFMFFRGDCPSWEADGEVTHEGLIALDSLILGWKQEHKPSLRFGGMLRLVSNTDLNSGSIYVWLCLRKVRPLCFLQEASLLCLVFTPCQPSHSASGVADPPSLAGNCEPGKQPANGGNRSGSILLIASITGSPDSPGTLWRFR